MAPYIPERGDFARIVLDPRTGREQSGERPVLVLSPRAFNEVTGYAFVAPITRTIRRWPFEVALPEGARVEGAVLVAQHGFGDGAGNERGLELPGVLQSRV